MEAAGRRSQPEKVPAEAQSRAFGEVITTAVMTAAVVPFAQSLAKKAAEDSYEAVRSLLRRMFREARAGKDDDIPNTLLIIQNDDPQLNARLYARPDMSDVAIRGLADLSFDQAITGADRGKVVKLQVFWNEAAGCWQVNKM